jgi:hypothetical protein
MEFIATNDENTNEVEEIILLDLKLIYGLAKYCVQNNVSNPHFVELIVMEFKRLNNRIDMMLYQEDLDPRYTHVKATHMQLIGKLLFAQRIINTRIKQFTSCVVDDDFMAHAKRILTEICCAFGWMKNLMKDDVATILDGINEKYGWVKCWLENQTDKSKSHVGVEETILAELCVLFKLANDCVKNDELIADFKTIMIDEFGNLGDKIQSYLHQTNFELDSFAHCTSAKLLLAQQAISKFLTNSCAYPTEMNRQCVSMMKCSFDPLKMGNHCVCQLYYEQHVELALKEICCAFDWMELKMNGDVKDVLAFPSQDGATTV